MVIEKVHGLQATSISLNERFTMISAAAPDRVLSRPRRRSTSSIGFLTQNLNFKNRMLIEQIARRLQLQAKRRALRQRMGMPQGNFRRYNSESNLSGLRRSNSFGNLSQQSVKSRVSWRQSNGNLRRAASFGSLSVGGWRGRGRGRGRGQGRGRGRGLGQGQALGLRFFQRRGGGPRALRGRFRGGRPAQAQAAGAGEGARGRGRGRGRGPAAAPGGIQRNQLQNKPVLSKEELDAQLDQYMASSKSALDKELDAYMKNAMELE